MNETENITRFKTGEQKAKLKLTTALGWLENLV